MARIDTSIYNNLQPTVKLQTPFELQHGFQNIQQGQNQNRLAQMQFQEADRVAAERNALTDVTRQYGNSPEYKNKLLELGNLDAYQKQAKFESEQQKAIREAKKAQIEDLLQKFDVTERVMSGVRDEQTWQAARQELSAVFPEAASSMPQNYDPVMIEQNRAKAMPLKDRLAQQWKELDAGFKERDFRLKAANEAFNPDGTPNAAYQNYAINKATAGATQNYGSPVAGMQNGKPVFFQPSKGGGAASIVPGIEPPARTVNEKSLPTTAIKSLTGAGQAVEDTNRLTNTFKDGYGGKTILGNLSNTIGRLAGDDTGQAQWWQDMDQLQNQTRHELFGSALTKTELSAWEKTSVNPRMNAGEIKKNLLRRQEIEARAASKLARGYAAAGYSKDQINELLGTAAEYLDKPAPPAGNKGVTHPKFPGFSIVK